MTPSPNSKQTKRQSSGSRKNAPSPASIKTLEFPYKASSLSGILTPAVPVQLVRPDGNLQKGKINGIVDTGADYTAFPDALLPLLGIDKSDCEVSQVGTAAGTADQLFYPPGLTVVFKGRKIRVAGFFNPGMNVVLLGRIDFMAHFTLHFDERQKKLTMVPYVDAPDPCPVEELERIRKAVAAAATP